MARTGRPPKPTAIKLLTGNPGHRPLPADEPRPALGVPDPPEHLTPAARAEWDRVTAELAALGMLTRADRATLAVYCTVYARWCQAEEHLAAEGPVYVTAEGNKAQSPWLWVANKAVDQLRHYAALFGLDPSSRTRIRVPPRPEADPLEEWINGEQRG